VFNPRGTSALLPSPAACASQQKNAKSMGRHADPTDPEHRLAYLLKVSLIYQIPHFFHNLLHGRKHRLGNFHVWLNMFDILGIVDVTRQALFACRRVGHWPALPALPRSACNQGALPQLCPRPKRSRCLTSLSLLSPTHRSFRPSTRFNKS